MNPKPCEVDVSFVMLATGVDEQEARDRVRKTIEAVEEGHHVYRCIERAMFAIPRIAGHPYYPELRTSFSKDGFRLLELGCCFGTDARKMIHDGLPPTNLVVSDLHDVYWNFGKSILYQDQPPVQTIFGDFAAEPGADGMDLIKSESLADSFSVVSAQAILHVLSKEQCTTFLHNALRCLKQDGTLFGSCVGNKVAPSAWGETPTKGMTGRPIAQRFLHSTDSLAALLGDIGFKCIDVREAVRNGAAAPTSDDDKTHLVFVATK
ncbi:hypothetical protein HDU67_000492 [Dinochytrium kinnereticum]|nr:hypothetical protein HDU67_000492 [Dinochytrium kinnereticum]